jgi:hypothetical protein
MRPPIKPGEANVDVEFMYFCCKDIWTRLRNDMHKRIRMWFAMKSYNIFLYASRGGLLAVSDELSFFSCGFSPVVVSYSPGILYQ